VENQKCAEKSFTEKICHKYLCKFDILTGGGGRYAGVNFNAVFAGAAFFADFGSAD
jgi:hypothetical protein